VKIYSTMYDEAVYSDYYSDFYTLEFLT